MWPYRLVTSIWHRLTAEFQSEISIETCTPAESISTDGPDAYPYRVHTPRGPILTSIIVHATDAFAGKLIPGLRGRMTGIRVHMTAQRPGTLFPGQGGRRSWSLAFRGGYDYVTQRPGESPHGGQLMIGGTFNIASNDGLDEIGVWDDSMTDPIAEAHLFGILPAVFGSKGWGEDADGGRLIQAWSGIVGFTPDMLPYAGPLDPRSTERVINSQVRSAHGEFVVGGYGGDGMVFAWLSGVAVGLMALGIDREDNPKVPGMPAGAVATWLPASFNPGFDRIKNSSSLDGAAYL